MTRRGGSVAPTPGDYFVVATNGFAARVIRWATKSPVNHAGIYIGPVGGGTPLIVEADPHGARVNDVSTYGTAIWSDLPLTDDERARIVAWAKASIGTKYNWIDIVCLALELVFRWKVPSAVLWRVSSPKTLICSQLVDLAYRGAGVHLFSDGRPPGAVTPESLYKVIQEGHVVSAPPGTTP